MAIRHITLECAQVETGLACGQYGPGYVPGEIRGQSTDTPMPGSVPFTDNGQKYLPAYRVDRTDHRSEASQFIAPVGVTLNYNTALSLAAINGGDCVTPVTLARTGLSDKWEQVCSHSSIDVE